MKKRDYYEHMWREFEAQKPLVMITGPRQAGKTVLARSIAAGEPSSTYLNYDVPSDKARLITNPAFFEDVDRIKGEKCLVVLDEIHKYRDWKNYLKGVYDGYSDNYRFLVTGSGRLDLFQRRGDALAGRYLLFHLFPFTTGELFCTRGPGAVPGAELFEPASGAGKGTDEAFATLMTCSGFPEPFLSGREVRYRRWAAGYHRQIVRNDIRDAFAVHDIDTMEALYALLIPRAGSPLSIAQLTDPLKTSHKTIGSWLSVFERLCLVFRVRPYSRRIHRSLLKAPKVYFYDYCRIADVAKRFENLVAVELRRAATNWTDYGLGDFDLFYLRNKEQEEVDFLVTRDGAPFFMVEVKLADLDVSEALKKFQAVLHVPAVQLVRKPGTDRVFRSGADRVLLTDAAGWLSRLG